MTIAVNCRPASDDADLLVEAAVAGLGLFYTTDWHVGPLLDSGSLVEVLSDWPIADSGAIYVLTPVSAGMPTKTRTLSNWIADGISARPWDSNKLTAQHTRPA